MEDKVEKRRNTVFAWSIYLVVLVCTVLSGVMVHLPYVDIMTNTVTSLVGLMVFVYYFNGNDAKMIKEITNLPVFIISFAISNALLVIHDRLFLGSLWLAATAVIAVSSGIRHAMCCYALLMQQYLILVTQYSGNVRSLIFYAVTGILLILLLSEMQVGNEFRYVAVVYMALYAVMVIVLYKFEIFEMYEHRKDVVILMVSAVVLLIISYVSTLFTMPFIHKKKKKVNKKLLAITDYEYEVFQKIEQYSVPVSSHSKKVAELSELAAEVVYADTTLAKAGGMYHELGRLAEKRDYITEGVRLAKEYHLPKQVVGVIRQQNTRRYRLKSREAAVVLLSDAIITTDTYLRKKEKRQDISDERLVKSVFRKRLERGDFRNTGFTDSQIKELIQFYIEHSF